jgi:hypothetical protein
LAGQEEVQAIRVQGAPPVVDGVLDDEAWYEAPALTQFYQRNPDEGAVVSESTVVRFAYTDRDLYVGFRAYDASRRIVGRLARRDQRIASDYFNLFIDSYGDRRTAYEFAVNPSGARRDVFIYDDGGGRDDSWDPVYDWATKVDSLGWTVEMRIPFSQLRFPQRDSLRFGIRVRRAINRRNEEANWPFFPRDQAGEVSRYGDLVGLVDVPSPRRFELLPYTAGAATFAPAVPDNPFQATGRSSEARVGGDIKVGVTSGITLDLTVNPDFGQVEADPAVVNLTAFETFLPEKRPFFIEGTNLFQFGLQPAQGGEFGQRFGGEEGLVYTRRVGRAPQVAPDAQGGYADDVTQTTILGAAKMSGQLGRGWSLGLLQSVTSKEYADVVDSGGLAARSPIEPLTSQTVLRLQRSVSRGRLAYGVLGTGLVRHLDESAFDAVHQRAFSGGADLTARLSRDRYKIDFAVAGTHVAGSPEAMIRTQRSSARYFQRPDQDYMSVDSSATSLQGFAGYAQVAKVVGFWTWQFRYTTRSPGFETNDLGFLRQADQHQQRGQMEFRWLTPGRVFRQFEITFEEQADFTYAWERTRTSVEARVSGEFRNYWNLNANVERRFPSLDTRLLRGGPAVAMPGAWDMRIGGRTDFRRPISLNGSLSRTVEPTSGTKSWRANLGFRVRPPGHVGVSLDLNTTWGDNDQQYVGKFAVDDTTYYVLGRLDRRELSTTLRLDLTLTPRLSFEFYGQPLVSLGHFQHLKLAASPRAAAYADRFDVLDGNRINRPGDGSDVSVDVDADGTSEFTLNEPDFRILSLRTSAVLRWEFRPGSTLYLVWQQNRRDRTTAGTTPLRPSLLGDVFDAEGTHTLAVKVAYWIGL